jgi:hypothetical protein
VHAVLTLSEVRRTITYGIGRLLYDWNNLILLRQHQHKRIHKSQDTFVNHLFKKILTEI